MGSDRANQGVFGWRGGLIQYQGPLVSTKPDLMRTVTPRLDEEIKTSHFLRWLLAEPESVALHLGLIGARNTETEADRADRAARRREKRALGAELLRVKEISV